MYLGQSDFPRKLFYWGLPESGGCSCRAPPEQILLVYQDRWPSPRHKVGIYVKLKTLHEQRDNRRLSLRYYRLRSVLWMLEIYLKFVLEVSCWLQQSLGCDFLMRVSFFLLVAELHRLEGRSMKFLWIFLDDNICLQRKDNLDFFFFHEILVRQVVSFSFWKKQESKKKTSLNSWGQIDWEDHPLLTTPRYHDVLLVTCTIFPCLPLSRLNRFPSRARWFTPRKVCSKLVEYMFFGLI